MHDARRALSDRRERQRRPTLCHHHPGRYPALLFVVLLAVAPAAAQAQLTIGPHLQDLRSDGVTVVWAQERPRQALLTVGGKRYVTKRSQAELVHKVKVRGLKAGTSYDYTLRVGRTGTTGTFRTAPSRRDAPFRFAVFGDNRTMHAPHRAVVKAMVSDGPFDFLVNTGDMVERGGEEEQWRTFFEIEAPLLRNTPWYPVIGNHELVGATTLSPLYSRYLAPPRAGSGSDAYYSFTYANAGFIILDGYTNIVGREPRWADFDPRQQEWLAGVLERYRRPDAGIDHIFVFVHRPPYSGTKGRSGCHALRLLQPLFLRHGVGAIFAGHEHYLERGRSPRGLRYFVMGGGGAPLYRSRAMGRPGLQPAEAEPWRDDEHTVDFSARRRGFAVVSIKGTRVDVEIKSRSLEVLDRTGWVAAPRTVL